jgi:hypothetical protein
MPCPQLPPLESLLEALSVASVVGRVLAVLRASIHSGRQVHTLLVHGAV